MLASNVGRYVNAPRSPSSFQRLHEGGGAKSVCCYVDILIDGGHEGERANHLMSKRGKSPIEKRVKKECWENKGRRVG